MNCDQVVEDIINGKTIHGLFIAAHGWGYFDYIKNKLLYYPENANCLYYLGLIEMHQTGKTKYFDYAAKLGSIPAMYIQGDTHESDLRLGVQALKMGYIHDPFPKSFGYYDIKCLRKYIEELKEELEQEKLRPPEQGGSEYEKARKHFNGLTQK